MGIGVVANRGPSFGGEPRLRIRDQRRVLAVDHRDHAQGAGAARGLDVRAHLAVEGGKQQKVLDAVAAVVVPQLGKLIQVLGVDAPGHTEHWVQKDVGDGRRARQPGLARERGAQRFSVARKGDVADGGDAARQSRG